MSLVLGSTVSVYLQKETSFDLKNLIVLNETGYRITSVVPGDFDDDVLMDLLITIITIPKTQETSKEYHYRIYWGEGSNKIHANFTEIPGNFSDEPLVLE